ncbi:MAG: type I-E CRISPR-associated protein Cas7/Cse4/CasC [Ruminococcus sp.]|nr:type I-E CRISPR-associated protein Cas7/Cse4/CasC [Ruminococcus sp.]
MSVFVDFHILQTVPPSCVNRDDMGSPKTAVYGGTVRARVSSQAWKHAMRGEFKKENAAGYRTKHLKNAIADRVLMLNPILDKVTVEKQIEKIMKTKISNKLWFEFEDEEKTKTLFFISDKQVENFAELIINNETDIKKYRDALNNNPSVDLVLFGRMAASDPTLNVDAAAQVAHAISTHAVQNEYDYFTAVDDLQKEDSSGAAHIDTTEFNSSTLYRYASVNVTELAKTLGAGSTAEAVKKFGQAFALSMPTGKENTFANRTFPDMVYVTLRCDQPVNLCGAFEKPVRKSDEGYAAASEKAFLEYADKVYSQFAAGPEKCWLSDLSSGLSLPELLSQLEKAVNDKTNEV